MTHPTDDLIAVLERNLRAAIRGTDGNPDSIGHEHCEGSVVGYRMALVAVNAFGVEGREALSDILMQASIEATHFANTKLEYHRGCQRALKHAARLVARATSEDQALRSGSHE